MKNSLKYSLISPKNLFTINVYIIQHNWLCLNLSPKTLRLITVYYLILMKYNVIIWKISACHGISKKMIIFCDAAQNTCAAFSEPTVQNMRLKQNTFVLERGIVLVLFGKKQHNLIYYMLFPLTIQEGLFETLNQIYIHRFPLISPTQTNCDDCSKIFYSQV